MMIADALQDCRNAALAGQEINFAEIASDYGINSKLLERKFHESFPHGVGKIQTAADMKRAAADMKREKIAAAVSRLCKMYNLDAPLVGERTFRGERYIVICSDRAKRVRPWIAVSLSDGRAYTLAKFDV